MPEMKNREYRTIQPFQLKEAEKRIDSAFYVEGYAARFEPYVLWEEEDGPVYEKFDRDCFVGCDMSDIIMQYDHRGKVLARQRNSTLIVEVNDNGLFMAADLSKSAEARNMYEEISNGLVDRMSWGFIPLDYEYVPEIRTIVHHKVKKIFDVSAVSMPANENTDIHSRSELINGEIERVKQELLKTERSKEILRLKLKLGGF